MRKFLATTALASMILLSACTSTSGLPDPLGGKQADERRPSDTQASTSLTTRSSAATSAEDSSADSEQGTAGTESGATEPTARDTSSTKIRASTISYQRFDLGGGAGLDIPSGTRVEGDSIAGYRFEWGNLSGNAGHGGDEGGSAAFTYDEAVDLFARQGEVTYSAENNGLIVVSGYRNGLVFYFATKSASPWVTSMYWEYPPEDKEDLDPVIEHIAASFTSG
ncbi:hypothetical protein [Corynebacterium cystitidis]|uniref:hypothetical protein n=1 Tax=Corynebacterium cystitidis TaxID=35757 RepID=UPI00211EF4C4|nr:hypothetical protein [Corynebacterium cystitidis]